MRCESFPKRCQFPRVRPGRTENSVDRFPVGIIYAHILPVSDSRKRFPVAGCCHCIGASIRGFRFGCHCFESPSLGVVVVIRTTGNVVEVALIYFPESSRRNRLGDNFTQSTGARDSGNRQRNRAPRWSSENITGTPRAKLERESNNGHPAPVRHHSERRTKRARGSFPRTAIQRGFRDRLSFLT